MSFCNKKNYHRSVIHVHSFTNRKHNFELNDLYKSIGSNEELTVSRICEVISVCMRLDCDYFEYDNNVSPESLNHNAED